MNNHRIINSLDDFEVCLKSDDFPARNADGLVELDLTLQELGEAGAARLAKLLQHEWVPDGLLVNLDQASLGFSGAEHIAAALESGNTPSRLWLNLNNTTVWDAEVSRFLNVLMRNTNVMRLSVTSANPKDTLKLAVLCMRNEMLQRYPQHAVIIKQVCADNGFFDAAALGPRVAPLKALTGKVFNEAGLSGSSLPEEVKELLNQVRSFEAVLKSLKDNVDQTPRRPDYNGPRK